MCARTYTHTHTHLRCASYTTEASETTSLSLVASVVYTCLLAARARS